MSNLMETVEKYEGESNQPANLYTALKQLRKRIDAITSDTQMYRSWNPQEVNPGDKTAVREMSLAITKLEEAKMWLGKALGALGSELPAQYADKAE